MIFWLTLRIENRNQVRTQARDLTVDIPHNQERLSKHFGLFTEESYTVPSINIYVLWSQVGLGYKREAMSTLNICLNTMDKNQDLVFITFADVIFSWGAVVKFIKEMETKTNLHCTKADSLDFFSRKKSNERLVPAIFQVTCRKIF